MAVAVPTANTSSQVWEIFLVSMSKCSTFFIHQGIPEWLRLERTPGGHLVQPPCYRNMIRGIAASLLLGTSFPGVLYHQKQFLSVCVGRVGAHSGVGPFPGWEKRKNKAEDARIGKSRAKVCQGLKPSAWLAVPPCPCQKPWWE